MTESRIPDYEPEILLTLSSVYLDDRCELSASTDAGRTVLRISGGRTRCELVLAAGVPERLVPLLIRAAGHARSPDAAHRRYTSHPAPRR